MNPHLIWILFQDLTILGCSIVPSSLGLKCLGDKVSASGDEGAFCISSWAVRFASSE